MRLPVKSSMTSLLVGVGMVGPICTNALADVKVAVTIKPLQSLVAAVMDGAGQPMLVMPATASPHTYTLTPSKAAILQKAQVVFQIAPDFEVSLTPAINKIAAKAVKANFEGVAGLRMLKPRGAHHHHAEASPNGQKHGNEDGQNDHDKDHLDVHHGDHNEDWHVWLDPQNASAMTAYIAQVLVKADPENASLYARNAKAAQLRLKTLEQTLRARLAAARGKRFVVFHDGYQHFEKRFGLSQPHFISLNPQAPTSAAHLKQLYAQIKTEKISCVFTEPQFNHKLIDAIAAQSGAKTATLDPLGATIKAGPGMYFKLLENLATQFKNCLGT